MMNVTMKTVYIYLYEMSINHARVINLCLREKGRDLTQSYDKSPYTNINVKRAK